MTKRIDERFHNPGYKGNPGWYVGVCLCGWRSPTVRKTIQGAVTDAQFHVRWVTDKANKGEKDA